MCTLPVIAGALLHPSMNHISMFIHAHGKFSAADKYGCMCKSGRGTLVPSTSLWVHRSGRIGGCMQLQRYDTGGAVV